MTVLVLTQNSTTVITNIKSRQKWGNWPLGNTVTNTTVEISFFKTMILVKNSIEENNVHQTFKTAHITAAKHNVQDNS
jgi:hypothetical protein